MIVNGNIQPRMYEHKDPIEKKWQNINPKNLRKLNHFTRVCFSVCGLVILILGIVIRGVVPFGIAIVLTLFVSILCTIYSYIIYAKEKTIYKGEEGSWRF